MLGRPAPHRDARPAVGVDFAEVRALLRLADEKPAKPEDWPAEEIGRALKLADQVALARWRRPTWPAGTLARREARRRPRRRRGQTLRRRRRRARRAPPCSARRSTPTGATSATSGHSRTGGHRPRTRRSSPWPRSRCISNTSRGESGWHEALSTPGRYRREATLPPARTRPDVFFTRTAEPAKALRDSLDFLRRPLENQGAAAPDWPKKRAVGCRLQGHERLLRLPSWGAGDRLRLWSVYRGLARRLNDDTATADAPPDYDAGKDVVRDLPRRPVAAPRVAGPPGAGGRHGFGEGPRRPQGREHVAGRGGPLARPDDGAAAGVET